eukprot:934216-Pyramimonas_sp.AAC.2
MSLSSAAVCGDGHKRQQGVVDGRMQHFSGLCVRRAQRLLLLPIRDVLLPHDGGCCQPSCSAVDGVLTLSLAL